MTLLVPREETCLSIFQAADADAVGAANLEAGFEVDRVVEVQVFPGSAGREDDYAAGGLSVGAASVEPPSSSASSR